MNRGDDSGPCPRCNGPTECYDYDETPWGARGNYSFSCKNCGEFREVDPDSSTSVTHIFRNDAQLPVRADVAFSDQALPAAVDMVLRVVDGFELGKLHIHEFTSIKTRLPTGATVLSEMSSKPEEPKRCQRCGRLEETCDSGLYGDCIDYQR